MCQPKPYKHGYVLYYMYMVYTKWSIILYYIIILYYYVYVSLNPTNIACIHQLQTSADYTRILET